LSEESDEDIDYDPRAKTKSDSEFLIIAEEYK
jgi:hypothetical protein